MRDLVIAQSTHLSNLLTLMFPGVEDAAGTSRTSSPHSPRSPRSPRGGNLTKKSAVADWESASGSEVGSKHGGQKLGWSAGVVACGCLWMLVDA